MKSRFGGWLLALMVEGAASERQSTDMVAHWPGGSTEPFTMLWYALVALTSQVFDGYSDPRVDSLGRELSSRAAIRLDLSERDVNCILRVAIGDPDAEIPNVPADVIAKVCMYIAVALARDIPASELLVIVERAEAAAIAQGVDLP